MGSLKLVRAAAVITTGREEMSLDPTDGGVNVHLCNSITATIDESTLAKAAQLPATLGGKAAAASLAVTLATEDAAKVPALGQALAAGSVPVVLTVAQLKAMRGYAGCVALTGDDSNDLATSPAVGIKIGTGGLVKVNTFAADGTTPVTATFTVSDGELLPIPVTRLWSSVTTATGVVALY